MRYLGSPRLPDSSRHPIARSGSGFAFIRPADAISAPLVSCERLPVCKLHGHHRIELLRAEREHVRTHISGNATTTSGGGFNIASGCFSINGVCLVDTDTVDGSFSTTSADYWETQQWRWSTSSSQYFESTQWRWSTTSSDFWDSTKARWSTSSASYFLSQNQPLAFGTSSNDFWLSQYAKGFFFSTTSADYWQSQRNFFSTTSAQYFLSVNQGPAFSTTSASYFLSQNQSLGFGTSSSDYWLSQYGKGFFFSTTSADAWDATKARWSTSSWRWKSRKRAGRSRIDRDLRDLIRRMSQENPLWGAPRIHGELLKLGFAVSQSTVAGRPSVAGKLSSRQSRTKPSAPPARNRCRRAPECAQAARSGSGLHAARASTSFHMDAVLHRRQRRLGLGTRDRLYSQSRCNDGSAGISRCFPPLRYR